MGLHYLPSNSWPDRSLPFESAPGGFSEQWGAVPKWSIGKGALPLYGIPASGAGGFISNAEQTGALPEKGIPIGSILLRGIPIYGSAIPPAPTEPERTTGGRWKYKPERDISFDLESRDLEDLMMLLPLILE